MFGVSFTEMVMIALVALLVFGPQRLPGIMRSLGEWIRKLRMLTTDLRAQSGIDDVLREEGIQGGLSELRSILRGDILHESRPARKVAVRDDPYVEDGDVDCWREYPPEGVDAGGALADDLLGPPAPPNTVEQSAAARGDAPKDEALDPAESSTGDREASAPAGAHGNREVQ